MSQIPRSVPVPSSVDYQTELNQKNNFIFDAFHAFDELLVEFVEEFTHEYLLDRVDKPVFSITFIIPTTTMITAMMKINRLKPIRLLDDKIDYKPNDREFQISCFKRSFGNWKVMMTGTRHELTDVGSMILTCQLAQLDYITIELNKAKYYQLCELNVLQERDITLIPTGYKGYLVNVNISQENVIPILNALIEIYNTGELKTSYERSINKQHILQSVEDISTNRINSYGPIKSFVPILESNGSIAKLMKLTKAEIGFLIGKNGDRINTIRNQTGCKITISPLPVNESHLLANKKILQSLKIFGSVDKVENAIKMINVNLAIYRENNSSFL